MQRLRKRVPRHLPIEKSSSLTVKTGGTLGQLAPDTAQQPGFTLKGRLLKVAVMPRGNKKENP